MENLPLIKWHAQELCKLLQNTGNTSTVQLQVDIETILLNSISLKNIVAAPPVGKGRTLISTGLKFLKQKVGGRKAVKSG